MKPERINEKKELFQKELNSDFKNFTVYFDSDNIILAEADKKLKELGATSLEKAVPIEMSGINYLPYSASHSRKLKERLMVTDDGKIWVRIKK